MMSELERSSATTLATWRSLPATLPPEEDAELTPPFFPDELDDLLHSVLVEVRAEIGADVEFVPFDGPHTIPEEALIRTVALLESLLE